MKKNLFLLLAFVATVMISCKEDPYMPAPGDPALVPDTMQTIVEPEPSPDPIGFVLPEGTINVYEAVKLASELPVTTDPKNPQASEKEYYIKGWVRSFDEKGRGSNFEQSFAQYGNDYVHLSARSDGRGTKDFYCYRILGKGGSKLPDLNCIEIGDFIVVKCKLLNFKGTMESSGTCSTEASTNEHFNEVFPPFPGCPEPGPGEISVNRAKEISDSIGMGKTTDETYKIRAVVTSVSDKTISSYGNLTFNISSDGEVFATCYRLKAKNGDKFTDLNQLVVNDTILVEAKIQNYNGTCEPTQGNVIESTNPNYNAKFNPAQ